MPTRQTPWPRGSTLGINGQLVSANGRYTFTNQGDGNLVLLVEGYLVWQSVTSSAGSLEMQADGNLVLYHDGQMVWESQTNSTANAGAYLILQDDGNLCLYRADGSLIKSISNSVNPQPPVGWLGPGGWRDPGQGLACAVPH